MPRGLKNFLKTLGAICDGLELIGLIVRFVILIVTFVFSFFP